MPEQFLTVRRFADRLDRVSRKADDAEVGLLSQARKLGDGFPLVERLTSEKGEALVSSCQRIFDDSLGRDQVATPSGEEVRVDAALAPDRAALHPDCRAGVWTFRGRPVRHSGYPEQNVRTRGVGHAQNREPVGLRQDVRQVHSSPRTRKYAPQALQRCAA